ncbi:hypothetical protein BBO99_00005991 [Phytophthora kernoviae]|uniref:DUF423 domain-containing protein n=2 Tax=Phytophthora kernoviae TaxID=325452 RepID=A0A3R7KCB6_9STRA|nr:hypothetical protein G195_008335 [Phytophthora kernoviae 00238/432]KAG2521371.1 hypothetical protein JM16_005892 [Phytophthora kernoviae]KAG2522628.1 hypothetical protein JM18_004796 [Phytophthora kernoviae]RLN45866.1 hypothetical protein BBI17_006065 [Phytophthora kernoviae]RLN78411.1 hypothetical protein BBO99_00005991 [Phytophthora kernoviae]
MKAAVISPALSIWWKVGAISGASAVLLGAFGAHGLKNRITDPHLLKNWETAAHYQLLHSVVLLATPMCRKPGLAGGLITTGTILFSGSLYAMTLTGQKKLGAVTPIGGVALVAGWLALLL